MDQPLQFSPNRIWRTYQGGAVLDALEGKQSPRDDHWPEDWIASTTRARNPKGDNPDEGLSRCVARGEEKFFADLLRDDPQYFLGEAHTAIYGAAPRILVKYLDSAVRLHIQVHPTTTFARERLDSDYGKAEAYYIHSVRPDCHDPHVLIGFQRPPQRALLRRWILEQDLDALRGAFDPVPVRPGDSLFIPGGVPHAIGAGICMVELMEPSDWVVRCEFAHGGYTLPQSARFLNGDPELSLDCFDLTPRSVKDVRESLFTAPRNAIAIGSNARMETLVDETQTTAFRLRRITAGSQALVPGGEFFVGLVVAGSASIGGLHCPYASRLFFPAAVREWNLRPGPEGCVLLQCLPAAPPIGVSGNVS